MVAPQSSNSELPPVWAPSFQRGDRPLNVGESVGSLDTALPLAQALQLPADMAKERESNLEHLEKTSISHSIRAIQKMVEVADRARRGESEVLRLTTENVGLLRSKNKLGEENFKLKDTAAQLRRRLEAEERKRKEVEESFVQAAEELEKKSSDLKMLEDNFG
ncbi:hypothetical protein RHGRI_016762 [Rhododendron griersonianum]|uniref:Uncharacterized protein n=1 Tax=Rhododendron griersonianum TaxID=479676 RepID=A0AAV6JV96_9ERIC|nr:hypothetical protein RHGRI_016762 [Rhododendron griersonianum]